MKDREEFWKVKKKQNLDNMIENKKKQGEKECVFKPNVVI